MRGLIIGAALAVAIAAPAGATDYKLEFAGGDGKVIKGRGGLAVYDIRTDATLMRIVAPGNRITKRGTVRVLVMNLGQPSYDFGPEQVSVELADGTALPEVPYSAFDKGEKLIGREVSIAGATDQAIKARVTSLQQSASSGMTASAVTGERDAPAVRSDSLALDELEKNLPGARTLEGINGVLRPYPVAEKGAWGGYLLFDMPKPLQRSKTDVPVTIVVRTGKEVHRIPGVLKRV